MLAVAAAVASQPDTRLPWFFSFAIVAAWMLAVLGIGAIVFRRMVRRRKEREGLAARRARPSGPAGGDADDVVDVEGWDDDRALPPGA